MTQKEKTFLDQTAQRLHLTVDGESVTEDAVLANGNYYLPASFYTGLGVEL